MHADEVHVDQRLVRRLLAAQFPQFAGLPLTIVEPWGTDNGIWRLGDDLVIRLPRIHWAAAQVEHEAAWLPRLAPHLPVAIPEPVAIGEATSDYPYRWAVHRWLPGTPAVLDRLDPIRFAHDLAAFIRSLQGVDARDAPPARGRARPLHEYDTSTRHAMKGAHRLIDADVAVQVWEDALRAEPHPGPPVWVHGDLEGNCLVDCGRLSGVIDWGSSCAGDPAVDIQVVWSPLFTERSLRACIEALGVDDATLARSRGASINQACAALPYYLNTHSEIVARSRHKLQALGVPLRD